MKLISDLDDFRSGTIGLEELFKIITHKILNRDPTDGILKAFTTTPTNEDLTDPMGVLGLRAGWSNHGAVGLITRDLS